MFQFANRFNQDLSSWNIALGTDFGEMFDVDTASGAPGSRRGPTEPLAAAKMGSTVPTSFDFCSQALNLDGRDRGRIDAL